MTVQLNYAVSGRVWSASHEAVLADDSRSIALSSRIRLQNRTGRDFANARVRLALTDKGQFAPLVPALGDPRAARTPALRFAADGKSWVPERTAVFFDGTGEAQVFRQAGLLIDSLEITKLKANVPHHGVAVPLLARGPGIAGEQIVEQGQHLRRVVDDQDQRAGFVSSTHVCSSGGSPVSSSCMARG